MTISANCIAKVKESFPIYQCIAVLTGTLNTVTDGMHYGWVSPSLPTLLSSDSPIPMSNDVGSWIAVALLFGTCFGCLAGVFLLDRIGRKNTILFTSVPFFVAWMMKAFARSSAELLVARFLAGIGDGLVVCAIAIYVGEISNPNIRGIAGTYISVSLAMGLLLMNIIGSNLNLRDAALVASAVPVLNILTFSWMPETPYYLIMKGKHEQAKRSLKKLKGLDDVDEELERLTKVIEEQNSTRRGFSDLFATVANRKALMIGMGIRTAQALSGTIGITFYVQAIFKEGGGNISPSDSSTIYFSIYTIVLGLSSLLIDKLGRKPLLIISVTGAGLGVTGLGCYFYVKTVLGYDTTDISWISMCSLIGFVFFYTLGLQPISNFVIGELFPTNVKAFAATSCTLCYASLSIITSKLFQVAKDDLGMHVPFFGFGFCCVLSLLFIIFFVPETKGKTLEKIQEELSGKRSKTIEEESHMSRTIKAVVI